MPSCADFLPELFEKRIAYEDRAVKHLRLLTYIDEVARVGSIRKAAERLNITASALNRRVQDIEDELGTKIFERLPRGVRLNADRKSVV